MSGCTGAEINYTFYTLLNSYGLPYPEYFGIRCVLFFCWEDSCQKPQLNHNITFFWTAVWFGIKIALHTPEIFMFFHFDGLHFAKIWFLIHTHYRGVGRLKYLRQVLKPESLTVLDSCSCVYPAWFWLSILYGGFEVCLEILVKSYYSIGFWEPKVCFFLIESPQIEILFQVPTGLYTWSVCPSVCLPVCSS